MLRDKLVDDRDKVVVGHPHPAVIANLDLPLARRVEEESPTQSGRTRVVVVVDVVLGEHQRPPSRRHADVTPDGTVDVDEGPPVRVKLTQDGPELSDRDEVVAKAPALLIAAEGELGADHERMKEQV